MSEATVSKASESARGLRHAGLLITLGLIVELITLNWAHPTAFLAFAFFGATLVALGVIRYVYVVLGPSPHRTK